MKLRHIAVEGFKSIDTNNGLDLSLGNVTVLLGANNSGKSNLVSFFDMLNFAAIGTLDQYVQRYGSDDILFCGPEKTESLFFALQFEDADTVDAYRAEISYGIPDKLFFTEEEITLRTPLPDSVRSAQNSVVSMLREDPRKVCGEVRAFLEDIWVCQIRDTSDSAKIRERCAARDGERLHRDGSNLAAFLNMLKNVPKYKKYYTRIVRYIQCVMPQFGAFDLDSIAGKWDYVCLDWRDSFGNFFGSRRISDGSLRFMALAALLLQPPNLLPKVIALDGPEIGLHPAAITALSSMINIAARHAQILIATQSPMLIDAFSAEELVVVERDENRNCSVFKKLDVEQLGDWLERYSLSELWEKNVIGGLP